MNDHVEYFALVARILELAGISAEDADLHFWRPGSWPELRDPAVDNGALRSKLNDLLIELVDRTWVDRVKPAELTAAIADLQRYSVDRVEPSYSAESIKALKGLELTRRRPRGYETHDLVPMTNDEWLGYQEQQRRLFTIGLAGDIDYIMQDVALIAEKSGGLLVAEALQVVHEALTVALAAVRAQVEAERNE